MEKLSEIEQLFNSMLQLNKLLTQHVQISWEEKLSSMLQLSALDILSENEGFTVSELANLLHLSKSSSTQLVERLVKSDSVKRISDSNDRRVVRLFITKKGENDLLKLKQTMLERLSMVFKKIPNQDIKHMLRIHQELLDTIKKGNL